MYTFDDRDGGSLTLRPEATAGIVRAVIEHNLMNTDPALRVYAIGPMFRRERPQKGRYRQFHQVDVEAFGFTSPTIDAEVIELALALPRRLRRREPRAGAELRRRRRAAGRPTWRRCSRRCAAVASSLCADCQRRAETNPLRVLDCKVPAGPGDDRGAAEDHRPPVRAVRRALRRGAPPARARSASRTASATGWCAASTTTCARPSR